MPRTAKPLIVDAETRAELDRIAHSRSEELRRIERAEIVLGCLAGKAVKDLAAELGERPNTIITWRERFREKGLCGGLDDLPRSGKPTTYGAEFRQQVLSTLALPPPDGLARWDGPTLARHLHTSADAIWRLLKKEGIQLARQRSWCVSTDPEFTAKAAEIVGLYLAPPTNAVVLSVDEKPSIQALTRRTGYVQTRNGKTVRAYQSTYRRNGTLNLFAALRVATGQVHGKITAQKKRVDFLAFMDDLLREFPAKPEVEYHVILDNYATHKKNETWLQAHPQVFFHYTPTSASWLNQVEIWFGIMTRKVLRGASFTGKDELAHALKNYWTAYNESAEPFQWRKREVCGSQIKNTISNLCN